MGDRPTEKQKAIYQETYDRQVAMEKCLKPGISSNDVAKAVLEMGHGKSPGNIDGGAGSGAQHCLNQATMEETSVVTSLG